MKKAVIIGLLLLFIFNLGLPFAMADNQTQVPVLSPNDIQQINNPQGSEAAKSQLQHNIENVIKWVTLIITIIAAGYVVIVLMIQGIKWMGSAGNAQKRAESQSALMHVLVGAIIALGAYPLGRLIVTITAMIFGGFNS